MAEATPSRSESRDEVLHVPNLFEYFCMRTADDLRSRGGEEESPATSFAGLIITILASFAFYVFGRPQLAKATFVLFGVLLLWTAWGVIIRSTEQLSQKADSIRAGIFPPIAAPFVMARLKWWNHLVTPLHWGKHSRLFDRRGKLERKIEDLGRKIEEALARSATPAAYVPPSEQETAELADKINSMAERNEYEAGWARIQDETERLKAEQLLYMALLRKLVEVTDRLDRIEKLTMVFQNVRPDDLSQVVSEAIQLLEERRILVLNVDSIDPEDFIDLATVRAHT